jgi:hypothetical protein
MARRARRDKQPEVVKFADRVETLLDRVEPIIREALTDVDPRVQGTVFAALMARWIADGATRRLRETRLGYVAGWARISVKANAGQKSEMPGPQLQFDAMQSLAEARRLSKTAEAQRFSEKIWPTIAGALAVFDVQVQGGVLAELLTRWGIGRFFIDGDPEATRVLREKMLTDAITAVLHLEPLAGPTNWRAS